METLTIDEVLAKASNLLEEKPFKLPGARAAMDFLCSYKGYFTGKEAERLSSEIAHLSQRIDVAMSKIEQRTISEVLAIASELCEATRFKSVRLESAKDFLREYEGYFSGEDAEILKREIHRMSGDIEIAKAKVESLTIDEVLDESYRIRREGGYTLSAITDAKMFLHEHDHHFTGKDRETIGRAFHTIFQDLDEAMEREYGPISYSSDKADEDYEDDGMTVLVVKGTRGPNDRVYNPGPYE